MKTHTKMSSLSPDNTLPMDETVELSDEELLELDETIPIGNTIVDSDGETELDDTIPIVRTIMDSDEEISDTELSEGTNYDMEISFSPVWQSSPQKSKTEQKSKSQDSSIKVLYEVINLTNSDSENSRNQLIMKKRIFDKKKVNIDVNNMCKEILMSIIYNTNMH